MKIKSTNFFKVFSYLLLTCVFLFSCNVKEEKKTIIIKNVNIIDVNTGEVFYKRDIVIKENFIDRIDQGINVSKKDEIIEADGKYIIPALWDMHVHFEAWGYEPMAKLMIANGVLGARDMGGDNMDRLDQMKGKLGSEIPNMRILRPGKMLDGKTPNWPYRITVTDSTEAKIAVINNQENGVDFIKVHQQLNKESFLAIAKIATEKGLYFAGHVPHRVGGIIASNAGQLSFEHLTGTPQCKDASCSNIESFLKLYKKNNTYQTPTLSIYKADVNKFNNIPLSDEYKSYINHFVKKEWATQDSINKQFLPPLEKMPELSKGRANSFYAVARKMFQMNVPVVAGTDAGFVGVIPGFDLHNELQLMVEKAGASNLQALQSATILPVKMYKLSRLGNVAKDNYADLLILNENPLENIKATRNIYKIISDGKIIDSKKIQHLKSECKKSKFSNEN